MGEALGVDVVQSLQHLLEVVAADALAECARIGHVVEELTSQDWLLCNVCHWDLVATLFTPSRFLFELVVFHDVLMVELLGGLDFLLEEIHGFLAINWVSQVEDLERVFCIVCIAGKLHLGAEARAQCLADSK